MSQGFIDGLEADLKAYFEQLRSIITTHDPNVVEKVGDVMSAKNGMVYSQEDTFKYALTSSKHHFSFHSMVMYANPDIWQLTQDLLPTVKQQKGCINFKKTEQLPLEAFTKLIKQSAQKDFSPVIDHYRKKSRV